MKRLIEPQGYQLDGLLFPVFEVDLLRGFTISEHRGYAQHMYARMASWDPQTWPRTLQEAHPYLRSRPSFLLSAKDFDAVLAGKWRPDLPRPVALYATRKLLTLSRRFALSLFPPLRQGEAAHTIPNQLQVGQLKLIQDIARYAKKHSLPVLVVHVPSLESLLRDTPPPQTTRQFATSLSARFVNGADAFAGLEDEEIRAHWFPYDRHWTQLGSDRFAGFMCEILQEWARQQRYDQ